MKKFAVMSFILISLVLISHTQAESRTLISMPLNDSIFDECGNVWITRGSPVISRINPATAAVSSFPALQLDGRSYLQMRDGIILGGRDFKIEGWAFIDSACGDWGRIFEFNVSPESPNRLVLSQQGRLPNLCMNINTMGVYVQDFVDRPFHFMCAYEHKKGLVSLYVNGEFQDSIKVNLPRRKYSLGYIGKSSWTNDELFVGYVYGFKVSEP